LNALGVVVAQVTVPAGRKDDNRQVAKLTAEPAVSEVSIELNTCNRCAF